MAAATGAASTARIPATPELLYLETTWASLSSYGTRVKLLQDVLPFDAPLEPVSIRHHVCTLAERLEEELGDAQVSFIEGCPRDWGELPRQTVR